MCIMSSTASAEVVNDTVTGHAFKRMLTRRSMSVDRHHQQMGRGRGRQDGGQQGVCHGARGGQTGFPVAIAVTLPLPLLVSGAAIFGDASARLRSMA
jgi:hypothetical protein